MKFSSVKRSARKYYCLKFNVQFPNDYDTYYLAYSRPYTYSEMIVNLVNQENLLYNSNG